MKRLPLALVAILMFAFGPVPSARAWWWHKHHDPPLAGVGADKKSTVKKAPREARHHEKPAHIYNKPRSFGWWHHDTPGPMGAGAPEK